MGINVVAVYSDADRYSPHTLMADEAIYIGGSPAQSSYLDKEKIISAMKQTGAEAVHPGYGFLSENSDFAREVEKNNLVFIGPPSSAIDSMGDKISSDPRNDLFNSYIKLVRDLEPKFFLFENVKGFKTTEGSHLYSERVAQKDDQMVARLRAAGALFIGKTNTPEFGLGSNTFNPVYGKTKNPYDLSKTCGGSSGGAAVALATRMLSISDGSDMMGSLRNPAAWNNVYGLRPTWGLIPPEPSGEIFLSQFTTLGQMARSPKDLAMLLDVQANRAETVSYTHLRAHET